MEKRPEGEVRDRGRRGTPRVLPPASNQCTSVGKGRDRGRDETDIGHKPSLRRLSSSQPTWAQRDPPVLTGAVSAWGLSVPEPRAWLLYRARTSHMAALHVCPRQELANQRPRRVSFWAPRREAASATSPRHSQVPLWSGIVPRGRGHHDFLDLHACVCGFRVIWD